MRLGAKVRHFFPGGNTAYGFYSFYDQIISPEEAKKIFILKGGPGTGKSTFMRQIAAAMAEHGLAVEFMQCSSDNDSLDGVVFPEIKAAIIDGTAPHVVDPKYPGAVEEIINLGEYWDNTSLHHARNQIIALTQEIEGHFARAYQFLRAAEEVREAIAAENRKRYSPEKPALLLRTLVKEFLPTGSLPNRQGRARHLFVSAITPDGPREYLASVFSSVREKIVLTGPPGTGKSTILKEFLGAALANGLTVECFHCGLDPRRVEHLHLPEVSLGLITANEYHPAPGETRRIDLLAYLGLDEKAVAEDTARMTTLMAELLRVAVEYLRRAKTAHDRLEEYYVKNMDFTAVKQRRDDTLTYLFTQILPTGKSV